MRPASALESPHNHQTGPLKGLPAASAGGASTRRRRPIASSSAEPTSGWMPNGLLNHFRRLSAWEATSWPDRWMPPPPLPPPRPSLSKLSSRPLVKKNWLSMIGSMRPYQPRLLIDRLFFYKSLASPPPLEKSMPFVAQFFRGSSLINL